MAPEIACGRRTYKDGEFLVPLVNWMWQLYVEGKVLDAADEKLNKEFEVDEMTSLIIVGLWCTNPKNKERPTAVQVTKVLRLEPAFPMLPLESVIESSSFSKYYIFINTHVHGVLRTSSS